MNLATLEQAHRRNLLAAGRSPDTIRFYRQAYRALENTLGKESPQCTDISSIAKDDFYLVMEQMRERGCKIGSIHAIMRGFRGIFNWATEEEYLDHNPFQKVKMPSVPRELQPAIQPDVVQQVLFLTEEDGVYKYRNKAILCVLYDTGLRLSELARLELAHLDLQEGILLVRAGKGGHDRVVPFGSTALKALDKYLRYRKPYYPHEPMLWIGRGGYAFTKWGISQLFDGYASRLDIPRSEIAPHAWRRGFAVEYLRRGGELFALQQLMGHTQLEMTRRYVRYLTQKKSMKIMCGRNKVSYSIYSLVEQIYYISCRELFNKTAY